MKNKFIELPVYQHLYKKSGFVTDQLINVDHIIRVYSSDNYEYIGDTFIEINRQNNTNEPLRVALEYTEVIHKILNSE